MKIEEFVQAVNDRLAGKNEQGYEEYPAHDVRIASWRAGELGVFHLEIQWGTPGQNGSGGGSLRLELLERFHGKTLIGLSWFQHVMDSPTTARGQYVDQKICEFDADLVAGLIAL